MPDLDPATIFAPRFNALGAPWAATGSIASTVYGEVRSTNDIDIIVLLDGRAAEALPRVFPETQFYCPPSDVIEIERGRERHGHFNLVHHDTGWKACTSARATPSTHGLCGTDALSNMKACKFG